MPANYVLLEKVVVGAAGAASVTFNSIPQTGYTDLQLVLSGRGTTAAVDTDVTFSINGSTSNFSYRLVQGNGSAASSQNGSTTRAGFIPAATTTASTFGSIQYYFPNYTSSNYKSISADTVNERNATAATMELDAILWSNTAAITSIALTPSAGNFDQYSTFSLYGVAKLGTTPAIAPKATGGDIIDYDGTYWIHTFLSSGTFTPATTLSCDYLVVAGGGGGGTSYGAGGGAGGLRSTVGATGGGGSLESALSLANAISYTVTIGAGGANGAAGSNSVFSSITSTGGGVGGSGSGAGGAGGSGGGAGGNNGTTGGTRTASPVQGFNGGVGAVSGGAGGGGAGAIGGNASSNTGGAGGAGATTSISGTSTTYAGGGGGYGQTSRGVGGSSIGGSGGQVSPALAATNGVANRGGGGGGEPSGAGGSGIVIVRYLAA